MLAGVVVGFFFLFKISFQALFEVWHFELFITKNNQNPVIVGC